jgi:hypothetical protein
MSDSSYSAWSIILTCLGYPVARQHVISRAPDKLEIRREQVRGTAYPGEALLEAFEAHDGSTAIVVVL